MTGGKCPGGYMSRGGGLCPRTVPLILRSGNPGTLA